MNQFEHLASDGRDEGLYAEGVEILQVNVGLKCNQSCSHCHLSASPDSEEVMNWPIMEKVLDAAETAEPRLVDITGGAPELNPHLKRFIKELSSRGFRSQVRTNLTGLLEAGDGDLIDFFKKHRVKLTGSLPCYLEKNVRAQRGEGVYEKSIEAMRQLNLAGYGILPDLQLDLVYNPGSAFLPGSQAVLESDYKRELKDRFGVSFSRLLTITNMPLGRFGEKLEEQNRLDKYIRLLTESFNPATVPGLMCRHQVSIGWDGTLYDCDFNLALDMALNHGAPDHIDRWNLESVAGRRIVTGVHCFGCTAGSGSSCAGVLTADSDRITARSGKRE